MSHGQDGHGGGHGEEQLQYLMAQRPKAWQLRTEDIKVWKGFGGEALERKHPKHIISKRDSCE
jgi:hypothetical protein